MPKHIVQSAEWAEFKTKYGTPAVSAGGVIYTKHKIPFNSGYFAYCPRVEPDKIDFKELKESLVTQQCISINFDVPNVLANTDEELAALKIFTDNTCVPSPRNQFAQSNIILDLNKSEDELLSQMHTKHRYNIRYAQKQGTVVKNAETLKDFDDFYALFEQTAQRQKYYVRPKEYYKILWEMFKPKQMCEILVAYNNGKPLASWMFLIYDNVLYYPYGGSSEEMKNLQSSNLVAWEGILLGKKRGCAVFDMWGASDNLEDTSDTWWGFTNFKLKFGGKYIKYMDSYDFVINDPVYRMFNFANSVRWKLLKAIA